MELTKTQKWVVLFIGFTIAFILVLGAWWIYLASTLYIKLEEISLSGQISWNVVSMLKWEGLVFFIAILSLFITLVYIYIQDWKKARALQTFFTSMTHELKTPLASIYLQSQVINDLINDSKLPENISSEINLYNSRISEDSRNLEKQIDSTLQLARLEWTRNLKLTPVNISTIVDRVSKEYPDLSIKVSKEQEFLVQGDDMALTLVLRNLFQNTRRHNTQKEKVVSIDIKKSGERLSLDYSDNGDAFNGDSKALGKLFYTHNSPNGSGVGLYLTNKLIKQLKGSFTITQSPSLVFNIQLKLGSHDE